jgi:2C-methyl-D-erythritol 2,4-cyclodiphosphate synthase
MRLRVSHGFDAHRLVAGRPLMLGGIEVPHSRGLEGHSDGDCALHAACDALLGAIGRGDMGQHFPSRDPRWHGVASRVFLEETARLVREAGFALGHLEPMRTFIAGVLEVEPASVSVKAKSTDHLGALGRGEGIAALSTVLLVGGK